MRTRAERRANTEKKAKRLREMWSESFDKPEGYFHKNHFGCSCWMCKPHKHGVEPKHKPSERRRLPLDE